MATDTVSQVPLAPLPAELHPNVDHLVTEDNAPVDGIISEKQMRLLTESLHTSWPGPGDERPFVAMANVGLFSSVYQPAIVPDVLVSVGVQLPEDMRPKKARSYFIWEYGKAPDIVVEVVSNREGGEDSDKMAKYVEIGIRYYVIFDPERWLSDDALRVFRLRGYNFEKMEAPIWFSEVELGLQLWHGKYEELDATWLRWVDQQGILIATGKESRDAERQRAESAEQRAESAEQRAQRLSEQLRRLGIEPNGK